MRSRPSLACVAFAAFACCHVARAEESLSAATIVVYNSVLPDSVELAKFYAQKRGIAADHLVGLACPVEEEISREQYDSTIANPLRDAFEQHGWWTIRAAEDKSRTVASNSIRFVALIRGIPLKVRATSDYAGDVGGAAPISNRNEASVDSELAVLAGFSKQISGAMQNPYFQSYRAALDPSQLGLMLVCRLDAPTSATVRRMITDAVETEKSGLWGRAFVDAAHKTEGGLAEGERWLTDIAAQLHKAGIPTAFDEAPTILPAGYPLSDCSLYYGWYAQDISGALGQPDFRFPPGAIAAHIHSFSAATLREPKRGWVGGLVTAGAAASLGNVYEPYLQLTTHLDIFNDRLLHGFTFAESAYMATRVLSWMTVMVGDPLYRPYADWIQIDSKHDTARSGSDWKQYHDFAVKNSAKPVREYRTLARQLAFRAKNGPMIEDLGVMEAHDGNFPAATSYFQQARATYAKRDDILRVVLEEADAWAKQGKPKRGLEVVRATLRVVTDMPAAGLLRNLERELNASPAPQQPKP
jgi:uncharacterized protein (TIGR03790 family)